MGYECGIYYDLAHVHKPEQVLFRSRNIKRHPGIHFIGRRYPGVEGVPFSTMSMADSWS
jgi:hypothetical protein